MSPAATEIAPGPLPLHVLGLAPSARQALALARVAGRGSSDLPVPEHLFPALDEARQRHLDARAHLARRLGAVVDQARLYALEDRARTAAVEAAAAKQEDSPPDERTPRPEREEVGGLLYAEAWAALLPLAQALDEVIAVCRHNEKQWLADLQAQLPGLNDIRAKAEQALAAAELEERRLAATGRWLQAFSDDAGGFSISPMVLPEAVPPGARGHVPVEASLSRPWTKAQPWNEGTDAPERPTRRQPSPALEPLDEDEPSVRVVGDGVGVILG